MRTQTAYLSADRMQLIEVLNETDAALSGSGSDDEGENEADEGLGSEPPRDGRTNMRAT